MKVFSLFALSVLFACSLNAQDTLKTYIFGHSLINHEYQVNITPSQETSVPHWFHFLAEEAGYNYATSGQYGFIPQHANLPPIAQWGFDYVAPAWNSDTDLFSAADFDNILITPGNFIQWQGPSVDYFNDTQSPLDYTSTIFDWVNQQEDSLTLYIYENWPDMAPSLSQGFPPSPTEWANYNAELQGAFHDWFIEYHDSLILAHPDHCVRMIPVGPVISDLLQIAPFNQIAIDTLYEDDAPHGRPSIYFLAAMVTYMAMFGEQPPSTYQVDPIIDPIIANNYQVASDFIWNELLAFNDGQGNNRVFCETPVAAIDEGVLPLVQLQPNPAASHVEVFTNLAIDEIVFHDAYGREVTRTSKSVVELEGWNSGVYFVNIRFSDGRFATQRLIIE